MSVEALSALLEIPVALVPSISPAPQLVVFELKVNFKFGVVIIQCIHTGKSWQTVQTQIRLLLEEQYDQGLHCLKSHLCLLLTIHYGRTSFLSLESLQHTFEVLEL